MLDLHTHILPALDDGPRQLEESMAMARRAVEDGVRMMVATPHANNEHDFDPRLVGKMVGGLNAELARAKVPLAVLPGAELALGRIAYMTEDDLLAHCLGASRCLLVEPPFERAVPLLEAVIADLSMREMRPLIAHPERCAALRDDLDRLHRLVETGALCAVNTGSLAGDFGDTVRRSVVEMFREGLVHVVVSDAHNDRGRPAGLSRGFEWAERDLPGIGAQRYWFTREVPQALLSGEPLPPHPGPLSAPKRWKKLLVAR